MTAVLSGRAASARAGKAEGTAGQPGEGSHECDGPTGHRGSVTAPYAAHYYDPPIDGPTPEGVVDARLLRATLQRGTSTVPPPVALVAKRALDVTIALTLIVLALPAMAGIAVIAWLLAGGSPVLYVQTRVGRDGQRFQMWKFRTLSASAEAQAERTMAAVARGEVAIDAAALQLKSQGRTHAGRFGRWLRATSLDELPQLWNVLRGDMSLIGPRPLRPFEVDALADWQQVRHELPPGLTGLWQVAGRNELDWSTRIALDCAYVRAWSFRLDLAILARTPGAVLSRRGAR